MAEERTVTNATLYSLLEAVDKLQQTVHANQLKYDIPELAATLADISTLRSDLDAKLDAMNAKLDQIIAQVTPPETGDLNLATGIITSIKE
jgi:uncharacterized phage infection (PIP) family protein YhgE